MANDKNKGMSHLFLSFIDTGFNTADEANKKYLDSGGRKGMNSQIIIDMNKCTGCGICELVCSLHNKRECNPVKSRISVVRFEDEGIMYSIPIICQQCEKPICKEVCRAKAIYRDLKTGALVIDKKRCFGCKYCLMACPFGGISLDQEMGIADKCDLCNGEPKCVEFCPKDALSFVRLDKIDIKRKREGVERYLENLKSVLNPLIEERGKGR